MIAVLMILIIIFLLSPATSKALLVQKYEIRTEKVQESIRLALITDLHSCYYGEGQSELVNAIIEQNPDLILMCGDIMEEDMPHDNSIVFLEAVTPTYPCYYVTGNHEFKSGVSEIKEILGKYHVNILEGEGQLVPVRNQLINICGVDDWIIGKEVYLKQLQNAEADIDDNFYAVLLTHRPELIEMHAAYQFDLVLSGHAHGGQWRIPGVLNGVFAANQGFFPPYAGGYYEVEDTKMVVSRGLAKETTFLPRIFNRPELVIVDIIPKENV